MKCDIVTMTAHVIFCLLRFYEKPDESFQLYAILIAFFMVMSLSVFFLSYIILYYLLFLLIIFFEFVSTL